jgi:hypothetical protein
MTPGATTIAGFVIPSADPLFLAILAVHAPLGAACVATGAVVIVSRKGTRRHVGFGTAYFWCLLALLVTTTALALMRWTVDYFLFVFGAAAVAAALFGRTAMRRRWPGGSRLHIAGMGTSYVLLLVGFYVDNGHQLPVSERLPHYAYWLAPVVVGAPLIGWALIFHPLARRRPTSPGTPARASP